MTIQKTGAEDGACLQLRANVVDIRRFSTHDGDGIRTTVFLKGCPLACAWCQNPETIEPRLGPVFFPDKCIDCGLCLKASHHGEMTRQDGRIVAHLDVDSDWHTVVDSCPTGAIAFNGRSYTVEGLVEEVMADAAFFGHGGGVTLSGGEPLFLPHFARAVLGELKRRGVHTAVESALNVRTEWVLEALPVVDQFYADMKIFDSRQHERWIGRPNDLIKANIAALLRSPYRDRVIVRTPLIPRVCATDENIAAIAEFVSKFDRYVKYELLNFNPLAVAKYELLPGKEFMFTKQENPRRFTNEEMARFVEVARRAGAVNAYFEP